MFQQSLTISYHIFWYQVSINWYANKVCSQLLSWKYPLKTQRYPPQECPPQKCLFQKGPPQKGPPQKCHFQKPPSEMSSSEICIKAFLFLIEASQLLESVLYFLAIAFHKVVIHVQNFGTFVPEYSYSHTNIAIKV